MSTGRWKMKTPPEEDLFPFSRRDHVGDVSALVEPAELLSLLRQREEEVQVAAELGKTLLADNKHLKRENERLQKEFSQKLEELEQEKYASRLKHEGRMSEWEAQVAELESDMQCLQLELQKKQQDLWEVEKVKLGMECELSEQNQRLVEQLNKAAKVEQTLNHEIHTLRERFMGKEFLWNENATRVESLHTEIALLSEQKHSLEQQAVNVQKENLALKSCIDAMQENFSQLQQKNTEQQQQLTLSQENVNKVQALIRELRSRIQELSEQLMMQEFTNHNDSLHSEIEHSLKIQSETWEAEKDQVKNEIVNIHQQLLSLTGGKQSDSLMEHQMYSVQEALSHLKNLVHSLVHGPMTQVLLEGDQKEFQKELKREESQFQPEQAMSKEKQQIIEELQRQLHLQSIDLANHRKENDGLWSSLANDSGDWNLQQAIRERDTALMKKNAVEVELLKCQMDMKSLNSQLLETIQQKVYLSQELEAWQDDMQFVINQQLKTQQQTEQAWNASSQNHGFTDSNLRHSFLRRTRSPILEGKGFLSLFKR
ncbi:BICD family-like cargo adapter 1 isoform X2 [Scyliorhinus canicula]|uniref:BICD family-like cargo adapter 1 isoform X2 n=1 Tax=Scyliorhinus canicula TaxID=7830 RepID=UPI0018F30FBF|nr:BICD family-like cargo adapter 1 isoform X2 [Scyliorhinus canicula]